MDGTDEELELRLLLERAVPHLPAPEERMGRVRGRVLRWRRRRRIAGAVAGVAAAAAAGVLLRTAPTGAPGVTEPGPAASPSAAAGTAVSYPGLGGVTVRLPPGWAPLSLPDAVTGRTVDTLYSAAHVRAPRKQCEPAWGLYCLPPSTLGEGGAVAVLTRVYTGLPAFEPTSGSDTPDASDAAVDDGSYARALKLGKSCVVAGGTAEFGVWRRVPGTKETTALFASVCVNGPTGSARGDVEAVLDSAVRTDAEAEPAVSDTLPGVLPDTPGSTRAGG